ncbi:MAG: vitamin K epoxide reductase family protein [Candidatus Nomurabacteria bacterium]|jgi:uncharacterized membrane protein|nr:vitamin K epoxide reductase family protein [Candidatus Nomurabacteria bacterium]
MKKQLRQPADEKTSRRWVAGILIVFSAVALTASLMLSVDYVKLLQNPDATFSCDINSALSCVSVMKTPQADVLFGIPNSFFGMMAFAVLLTIGVVLAVGAKLPKWFKVCTQIAALGGLAAAWWMFFDSLYHIGVLCPWCLTVTTSMTIMFGAITHWNLRENTFEFKRPTYDKILKFLGSDADKIIVAAILVIFAALAILKFGARLFG